MKNPSIISTILFAATAVFAGVYYSNNPSVAERPKNPSFQLVPSILPGTKDTGISLNNVETHSSTKNKQAHQTPDNKKYNPKLIIPGRTIQSATFSKQTAQSITIEGAMLSVPEGAMTGIKTLSVTGLMQEDLPPIPAEISNVTDNYPGYRFLPHGMVFFEPATISMAYDESLIPQGFTADDIYTYYFDGTDNKWKALERDSIDYANKLVVSNTLHFTDMINGVIKVPESPETGGFTPTSLNDIKAAVPTAGINLIAPPSANSNGDADISFPFKLPAGRAGMQPQLGLQYSSTGGSGWTGFGWGLSMPGISVDPSWGVPLYLPGAESETYLFGGSQLTPVAHRSAFVSRTAEKQFYPRIEGGFSKIIRHGNSPSNYWWEVTSKSGDRSFYGGNPESGLVQGAVSSNAVGNISYWALVEMRDVYGNNITYAYDKPVGYGGQLYISQINYTGKDAQAGPFQVNFLRDDATNTFVRNDATVSARMGYVQRDKDLLRRINITYNNQNMRSYTLNYKSGAFSKTLLGSVTELDPDGNEFYTHRFEYYDDVQAANGYVPYKAAVSYTPNSESLNGGLINPLPGFEDNVTALGGAGNWGAGTSTYIGIGLNNCLYIFNSLTVGANVSFSYSEGHGIMSLIDINGDGLDDKVYRKNDRLYFRPNIIGSNNQSIFGDEILLQGAPSDFNKSTSNNWGVGFQASVGLSYNYSHSTNSTRTKVYFEDFNGDGLVDIANSGTVYFNHINDQGIPYFSTSNGDTPNPILSASVIDYSFMPDPAIEEAQNNSRFPLIDAVRMWRAPFDGTVNINAPVNLIEKTGAIALAYTDDDGVKLSIQHRGNVIWLDSIESGDYVPRLPVLSPLSVNKGDQLYFRVQSRYEGSYDNVNWDPGITYTSIENSPATVNGTDANGKSWSNYKSSTDFVLCGDQPLPMVDNGTAFIHSEITKPVSSDSVSFVILLSDTLGNSQTVYARTFLWDETANVLPIDIELPVQGIDKLQFVATSPTNIDWPALKWNSKVDLQLATDDDPLNRLSFDAIPRYSIFSHQHKATDPIIVDSAFILQHNLSLSVVDSVEAYRLNLFPKIKIPDNSVDTLTLSVKTKNRPLAMQQYIIDGLEPDSINKDTIRLELQYGDTIFAEYYLKNFANAFSINSIGEYSVALNGDTINTIGASLFSSLIPEDELFGRLYRGWGQFSYNGNMQKAFLPIFEDSLIIIQPTADYSNIGPITSPDQMAAYGNTMNMPFNALMPYAKSSFYLGEDASIYVNEAVISSSRRGKKNVVVEPYLSSTSGFSCSQKLTTSSSDNNSFGVSLGPASLASSTSDGTSEIEVDVMDMNGDKYPDLLDINSIQYTSILGSISGGRMYHDLGGHRASSSSSGTTLGGNGVIAKHGCSDVKMSNVRTALVSGALGQADKNSAKAGESAKLSPGLSGNFASNDDYVQNTWMDINGDGLPDKVYNDGNVRLNLGYSFAPPEYWGFPSINVNTGKDYGGGPSAGFSVSNRSISGGLSVSKTLSNSTSMFLDVNSDGLLDYVTGSVVSFNTGSGFSPPVYWNGLETLNAGVSIGESINLGFTAGFGVWLLKFSFGGDGSASHGMSKTTTQLSDIDGDGMADFISSTKEDEMTVKSSTINRTNMLRTVHRPMGSNFTLDYIQTPGTFKHPGGKWALASVKSFDGLRGDGIDSSMVSFDYTDGYYDRRERQFYGFGKVTTNFHDTGNGNSIYRSHLQNFDNSNYYTNGALLSETLFDGNGRKQTGSENYYALRDIQTGNMVSQNYAYLENGPLFVELTDSRQLVFEGASQAQIITHSSFQYDSIGNIVSFTDYATGKESDRIDVNIEYHAIADKYIYSVPKLQEVYTTEGLMRQSETVVNSFGDIVSISQMVDGANKATFDMEYDSYGNLTKMTRPVNYKNERMWFQYEYDNVLHSFITRVTDAFGYSSSSTYDYMLGVPLESTDLNNQKMRYTYDNLGRMKTVTGPYELASGRPYTIAFNYFPMATVPYAQALHYDSVYNADIETYTFTDGLGRPVQVKKTSSLYNNNENDLLGYTVSGKVEYDAFGRAVRAYQPVFENPGTANTLNVDVDAIAPTTSTYDVLDRAVNVALPDGTSSSHSFGVATYKGETMLVDTITDALGHQAITFTDAKGRQAAGILKTLQEDITTGFTYNAIGEVLAVADPKGKQTVSVYDKLGRRVSVNQPDGGLTEYKFDNAGNILSKTTANLRRYIPNGGAITYKYDYNRLTEINYPRNVQNKVEYSYGAPGATFNRAGRLTLVQDASGGQEFFYGPQGEVLKTIRTIQLSENDMRTWIWGASYDTWNRVQSMTYPDGETVKYSYNRAGNLQSMAGEKLGRSYDYVTKIGYDKYEKQVYLQYGNGSVTTYTYDPLRQRLAQMGISSNGSKFMDNTYTYDAIGNILGISNSAMPAGDIGGSTTHSYTYDELNRLVQATGSYTGNSKSSNYTLSMQYDIMGNILRKNQSHLADGQAQTGTSYDLKYKYEGSKPNAASHIGECLYTYDENGNLAMREDTVTNSYRQMWWDEENRLMMLSDDGYVNNYLYDATGERVVKSHGGSQGIYINGAPIGVINHTDANYTVYVSPYFTMDANKFTKHYYAGSSRVTSKIGNGSFSNQFRSGSFEITAGSINYIARQQKLLNGVEEYYRGLGIPPGPPTMKGINGDPYNSGIAIDPVDGSNTKVPPGWPSGVIFAPPGGPPGPPIQYGDSITNNTVEPGFGYLGTGDIDENLRYFFHSDHLGSTSYITDSKGDISQFIGYMPFGEAFVEQHTDYDSPFKFNGKELDAETGLSFYGARYYDPKTSIFLGIDPLAEKYNFQSPFAYAANNPVRYIEINGAEPGDPIKNIYILTPHSEISQDAIKKTKVNQGNWHFIYAKDMSDGYSQAKQYLGDQAADNIIVGTHGAGADAGGGWIIMDPAEEGGERQRINVLSLSYYAAYGQDKDKFLSEYPIEQAYNAINGLIGINSLLSTEKGKEGNLILTACGAGMQPMFGDYLSQVTGGTTNVYVNKDNSTVPGTDKTNPDQPLILSGNLVDKYKNGWLKYPAGHQKGDKPIPIKSIIMNMSKNYKPISITKQ